MTKKDHTKKNTNNKKQEAKKSGYEETLAKELDIGLKKKVGMSKGKTLITRSLYQKVVRIKRAIYGVYPLVRIDLLAVMRMVA